jgi:hypothetical protein
MLTSLRRHSWLLGVAVLGAVLLVNTVSWHGATQLDHLRAPRRYWEDLAIATANYLDASHPRGQPERAVDEVPEYRAALQRRVLRSVDQQGIRFWEPWRTVPMERFDAGPLRGRANDDPGRSVLSTWAFRLRGGVAPFLPLWLGVLFALPVLAWTLWEYLRVGRGLVAGTFLLCCCCSPCVVDALVMPYGAQGFYYLALVVLVALGAPAFLGVPSTLRAHAVRLLWAGLLFAICVVCRSGTILMLPGFALVMAAEAWRFGRRSGALRIRSTLLRAAVGLAIFLAPLVVLKPARQHDVWLSMWLGLGDFDRTKGHVWADAAAKQFLAERGVAVPPRQPVWFRAVDTDPLFRQGFQESVASDPWWYMGILAQRVYATTTQIKLWPYGSSDGRSYSPAGHVNEGVIDIYYNFTTTADWLGLGPWRAELPLPLLWAPALLALAAVRRTGSACLALMGSLAVAALGLPVIVTTAGAIETQAFVLVYYLALGFVIAFLVRGLGSRTRMRALLRARAPSAAAPTAGPPEGASAP